MIKKLLYLLLFPLLVFGQKTKKDLFTYQLNHIGICVDSITFNSLLANKFITDTFCFTKVLKDSTGSEILLLGKEHFLQFYPGKGFFKNGLGVCILYHHSFTGKETNVHLAYLQSFVKDSLYNRPYRSSELNIDYINVYENLADTARLLKFIPVLQNHSKKDYSSWGYTLEDLQNGITQKKYMEDYVGKETKDKLLKNIESIQIATSADKHKRILPLLKAYGYKKRTKKHILKDSPEVKITSGKDNILYIKIHLKLSKTIPNKLIPISDNAFLNIIGDNAWFNYKLVQPDLNNK